MNIKPNSLLAATFVLSFIGTGCIQLNGDLPEGCLHYQGLAVPGTHDVETHQSFVHDDFGDLKGLTGDDLNSEIHFLNATITAKSGIDSFGFLRAATLTAKSPKPDSPLQPVEVVHCVSGDCPFDTSAVTIESENELSVVDYVKEGAIEFDLDFEGTLPEHDWAADVDVCFQGSVELSAGI
jgi:hypothetical protein